MRTLEPKKLVVYQCSRKGPCLHGSEMLLGIPVDISQPSILKLQSFVLWISFAGDICVLSGSDILFCPPIMGHVTFSGPLVASTLPQEPRVS